MSNDKIKIRNAFNRAANTYDSVADLQRRVGLLLLENRHYLRKEPSNILDLGSGTGVFADKLSQHYPCSDLFCFDLAENMLKKAKERYLHIRKHFVSDMDFISLPNEFADLIYANLVLQWSFDLKKTLNEVLRVMQPGGGFLFSTFGPNTLYELKQSWAGVNNDKHVNNFLSLESIKEVLWNLGFNLIHNQVETVFQYHNNVYEILHTLKQLGAHVVMNNSSDGLHGKRAFSKMMANYEAFKTDNNLYPVQYEVFYFSIEKVKTIVKA